MVNMIDDAYLLFAQAIPSLGRDARADVVELLSDGDVDLALDLLVRAIDREAISVDQDLLDRARSETLHLARS